MLLGIQGNAWKVVRSTCLLIRIHNIIIYHNIMQEFCLLKNHVRVNHGKIRCAMSLVIYAIC